MPDYRSLPSVTELASSPELAPFPERIRILASQSAIAAARGEIADGGKPDIRGLAAAEALRLTTPSLQAIHNFSGVILHTGLGRAPFEPPILGNAYFNLELDLEYGKRGDRQTHVRELLCELTGAEDALVVNNGAAGVLLALTAIAKGKQVLLSRSQSVEIGGSFRMPDIVRASGCRLVDVGTTNKTYVSDYVDAINSKTGAFLFCHPSNYEVTGFVASPSLDEVAKAAKANGVCFIHDQGNGALVDFERYGIQGIETLPQSVAAGADLTIASGDKLLGGPQAGIIVGRKDLIAKLKRHPLARVVRIDKVSLLSLESVLLHYRADQLARIPLHRILGIPAETVRLWCEAMAPAGAEVRPTLCELGSGSGSGKGVESYALVLPSRKPDGFAKELRRLKIIGRIEKDAIWLDPRCDETIYHSWRPEAGSRVLDGLKAKLSESWEKWK
ncbi:MAG: L-seryl-tRNA(Sec) selenium transferase [Armatimonadetes bacterium]|nr:L-seryl-tRNA(Sec) selenium transferase [Armatimonadota bacterium]